MTDGIGYLIIARDTSREIPGVSITAHLGALGVSGGTAYWALNGVLKPKETDTLVVSGAAG